VKPRLRAAFHGVLATALVLAPQAALACPKCLSGRSDETRLAYLLTTVFLSVFPLLMIGGLAFWLVRRARVLNGAQQASAAGARSEP
jgi:hypothetical protein